MIQVNIIQLVTQLNNYNRNLNNNRIKIKDNKIQIDFQILNNQNNKNQFKLINNKINNNK
jgi:hypothetical protein